MSNRDFRKTRWIGALVLASVFVLLSLGIGPTAEIPSSQPRTAGIVVGRDTTYLLGPLRADGTVDYIAAVNAEYSQGVTPENNAACLLVRVNPPEPSHDEDTPLAKQPELLRLLGFTGSVPEAIPWHNLKEFDPKFAGIGFIYPTSGYSLAMTGPWAAADMPAGKQWLDANKPALDLAVEASQRERYWMPVVSADGTGLLLTVAQPNSSRWRALTGSLQARAMLELQQGDRDVAWNDLWAVYRLASFLAHSTDEIDVLLSPIVERNAWIADRALMIDPNTSMDLLHRMSADMSVFVRAPRIRELGERVDRLKYLSVVEEMAQTWDKQLDTLTPPQRQQMDAALDALGLWQPDWNRVLRLGNDYWNDVLLDDSAMSADEQRAHWAEVVQRQNDLSHYDDAVGSGGWMIPKKGETRDAYSDQVGLHLLAVTAANVKMYRDQTDRLGNVELDWTEVAVNLVLYRRERGSYPQRLDELVPVYMNHLPPIVPDYPIHYEIQGNGCVLERDFPPATNPASAAATRPTTLPVLNGNFIVRLP